LPGKVLKELSKRELKKRKKVDVRDSKTKVANQEDAAIWGLKESQEALKNGKIGLKLKVLTCPIRNGKVEWRPASKGQNIGK